MYLISLCILVWLQEFIFLHQFALFLFNQKPNIGLIKLEIQNFQGRYELNSAIRSLDFDPLFFYNEKKNVYHAKCCILAQFFFFLELFCWPIMKHSSCMALVFSYFYLGLARIVTQKFRIFIIFLVFYQINAPLLLERLLPFLKVDLIKSH